MNLLFIYVVAGGVLHLGAFDRTIEHQKELARQAESVPHNLLTLAQAQGKALTLNVSPGVFGTLPTGKGYDGDLGHH